MSSLLGISVGLFFAAVRATYMLSDSLGSPLVYKPIRFAALLDSLPTLLDNPFTAAASFWELHWGIFLQ